MAISLVNPATQPQSSPGVPTSPIASMLDSMVGAYGKRFPTPEEQAQIDYLKTKTAQGQQELGAPQSLQDVINRVYNPKPPEAPLPDVNNPPGTIPTAPSGPPPSTDQLLRQNMPEMVGAMARAGKYGDIPQMARFFVANAPGVSTKSTAAGPSPVDMAMLGAGDSYGSTIGGMREHESLDTDRELAKIKATAKYGMTGAIKDHNFKVQEIMRNQGVDEATAEGIIDGVLKVEIDPTTQNAFLVNIAQGTSKLLRSPAQGAGGATPPGANVVAPGAAAGTEDPDYLTQLTTPKGGAASPQGGPVTLSSDAEAPALPELKGPADLKVNFNNALGGPATVGRLEGMISAAMGGHDPAATQASLQSNQLKDLQSRISAVLGLRPGMRNNASAQALITSQLPSSGLDITDAESWLVNAAKDPQAAFSVVKDKMNEIMKDRMIDAQMLADPDLSREDRQAAKERISMADKLMADYLPPDQLSQYQAASGSKLGPAAAAPKTNLDKGLEATTMPAYKNIQGKPPVTDADILHTAKTHKMTPQQVVDKLRETGQVE